MGPFPVRSKLLAATMTSNASKNPRVVPLPETVNLPLGTQIHPFTVALFGVNMKSPDVCQNRRPSKNAVSEALLIELERVIFGATSVILLVLELSRVILV